MTDIRTITDLRKHCKRVDNSFFSKGNVRVFGSDKHHGIYRGPYIPLAEGYIISETVFTGSDGVSEPPKFKVYRFDVTDDAVDWTPLGLHDSLADAEAFLASMGAKK
jgi:hypothetical protein